jgi:subtilisin family serine protease
VPNEVILSFRDGFPDDLSSWAQQRGAEELLHDAVLHWVSFRLPTTEAADRALEDARQRLDVRAAERDAYVQASFTPNDPLYAGQANWPAVAAPAAWDATLGSHAVKVAVLDTGIDIAHEDLAANACGPWVSFDPTEDALSDLAGHGTHVAGIVAAETNNAIGVAGASQSCLMGAKVLNRTFGGQWSWVAAGIRWAADNGADIISMSLGAPFLTVAVTPRVGVPPTVVGDAVFYAYHERDVLLVAAAGNQRCAVPMTLPMTEHFPALYTDVLAVAALTQDGSGVADFSSCGPDLELSAPGATILSTMAPDSVLGRVTCGKVRYCRLDGTSMATPHVAGVAALLKAHDPNLSAAQLRCILDLSAEDMDLPSRDYRTGWGRVDALAALQLDDQLTALGLHDALNTACVAIDEILAAGGVPDAPMPVELPV